MHPLAHAIRRSESTSKYWQDITCPIYKKGGITQCSNYKRIPVLTTIYKILLAPPTQDFIHSFIHTKETTGQIPSLQQSIKEDVIFSSP